MTIDVRLPEQQGWTSVWHESYAVWFKGYVLDDRNAYTGKDAANRLAHLVDLEAAALCRNLEELNGMFAFVVQSGHRLIAAVDRVSSIPILINETAAGVMVFDCALTHDPGTNGAEVDPDGALAVAMSGFTIGRHSIFRDTSRLIGGECVVLENGSDLSRHRYSVYEAWNIFDQPAQYAPDAVEEMLRDVFAQLAATLEGRRVVVPLSAGLDSRLIVSGLLEAGFDNIACFAYGRPGNHEAVASRKVAERLGLPWTFVPYSHEGQRAAFRSEGHATYRRFADSLTAVPFEQEYLALQTLRDTGWLDQDDVLINGQSGDYNTGNHIPAALLPDALASSRQTTDEASKAAVADALIAKHYSLWGDLNTPASTAWLHRQLAETLDEVGAPNGPKCAYALYELSEFENRQSKYTVGGQRVYEHFGLEWRLPMWEKPFVDFWKRVPVDQKFGQRLYRETLERMNWGDVWRDIDRSFYVAPSWTKLPRLVAKGFSAPFGTDAWHRVDRAVFAYWIDILCNYAGEHYLDVLMDRRGFRNAFSWFSRRYLERHDIEMKHILPLVR